MTEIDSLQISIETSSGNAAKGIDELAESLGRLKSNGTITTAVKNLNNLRKALHSFSNIPSNASKVLSLANSLEKLKNVGSVTNIGNSLTKLATSLKSLNKVSVDKEKIDKIADSLSSLSAVKAGGINTMMNGLMKIGKVTQSLDDKAINAFAERITVLTEKLTPLSAKMTTIQAGLKGINSSARSAGSGVKEMGEDLDTASLNMSSFIYTIQEAIQWLQAAIQKFQEFMAEAIEWDGIAARFGRGFGGQAQETYEWIQRLNEEMGINIQQFMKYSSVYATMLTGFGVANEDATKMALGYTELTYDIWAGYNDIYKTFDEAAEAVKSAIAGEVEPVRRAGFTIVESTLEQTAANHGLEISLYNATEAQKSYLRYLTLVDQAHAQGLVGTYAKELNTAEGLTRTLAQQMKSLTQAFGSLFLPILVRVVPWIQAFVELLTDGIKALAAFLGITIQDVDWSSYGDSIGNVADNTGNLGETATDAAKAMKELKNATLGIDELNVISPPSASSGAGGAGGAGGSSGFEGLDIDSLWDETIFDNIQSDVDAIKEKLKGWLPVIGSVAAGFAALRLAKLIIDIDNVSKKLKGIFSAEAIGKAFSSTGLVGSITSGISKALSSAAAALGLSTGGVAALAVAIAGVIILGIVDYDFTDVGHTLGKKIGEAIKNGFEWAKDHFDADSIGELLATIFNPITWFKEMEKFFENLSGNIGEFQSGFIEGLGDGLGLDLSFFQNFVTDDPTELLANIFTPTNFARIGWDFWSAIFEEEAVKDVLAERWDEAKVWWNEKKSKLSTYVPTIGSIKEKISSAWTSAKTWWNDKKGNLKTYTPSIGSIYEKVKERWNNAKDWWNNKKTKMKEYTPSIGSIYEKVSARWKNARDWWNKKKAGMNSYTPSIGSIKDKLVSAWNKAKTWWKNNVKLSIPSLSFKVTYSQPSSKVMKSIMKALDLPGWPKLSFAAGGGIFDQGSLVWAGERGPEVVANAAGGKTGVMNVQQMQDAVYEGVYAAVVAASRAVGGNGGTPVVNVRLPDGRVLASSVEKTQRERGANIMGNQVYSYG